MMYKSMTEIQQYDKDMYELNVKFYNMWKKYKRRVLYIIMFQLSVSMFLLILHAISCLNDNIYGLIYGTLISFTGIFFILIPLRQANNNCNQYKRNIIEHKLEKI